MTNLQTKTIKGHTIPSIGLGTFELKGREGEAAITQAIEIGYRQIDTAIRYGNELEVGRAIKDSGIDRRELFITSKIWFDDLEPEVVAKRVDEILERLMIDQLDLLLIHWPSKTIPLGETLDAFASAQAAGKTRLIGVSNFTVALLDEAIDQHKADLFCNQVEYHPLLSQEKLLGRMRRDGMLLNAYQPIARGKVFAETLLTEIGAKYGKSAAQVTLRWHVQQEGVGAIPRSQKADNLKANIDIFDFELSAEEMAAIHALARGERYSSFDWAPDWD